MDGLLLQLRFHTQNRLGAERQSDIKYAQQRQRFEQRPALLPVCMQAQQTEQRQFRRQRKTARGRPQNLWKIKWLKGKVRQMHAAQVGDQHQCHRE